MPLPTGPVTPIKFGKTIARLPDTLNPNSLYAVRVGTGIDLYVSDMTGSIAYKSNSSGISDSGPIVKTYNFVGPVLTCTGTARWYPESNITLSSAFLCSGTAPLGNGLTVEILKNGLTIVSVNLAQAQYKSDSVSINTTLTSSDYVTVNVTGTNSSSDAMLTILYTKG